MAYFKAIRNSGVVDSFRERWNIGRRVAKNEYGWTKSRMEAFSFTNTRGEIIFG